VALHWWDHFKATEEPATKLGVFSTAPAIPNVPLNLVSEIIGTFVLVFVIMAIGHNGASGGLAAVGALPVALLILAIGMSLGGTTGYAINPARDLGPRIAHAVLPIPGKGGSNWGYSWIPVVGPVVGAALAALTYMTFFTNFADNVIPA
jgi:glycerol uptake facilitator protein